MGISGGLFILKKRKRAVAVSESAPELSSRPYIANLDVASPPDLESVPIFDTEVSSGGGRHRRGRYNITGIREDDDDDDGGGDDSKKEDEYTEKHGDDGDDDDDDRLSCISNIVDNSSTLPDTHMHYIEHEDIIMHSEEQCYEQGGISMELSNSLISSTHYDQDLQVSLPYCCDLSTSSADLGLSSFFHSSGRPTLEQEAMYGMKRPTIDSEFEEYFASLLLK